jgi:serine phosphatase RsbU (regulator of sigma subunit)
MNSNIVIKSCKGVWNNVSDIGCHPELDYEEIRRIRLMNRLNFISALVLLIYMVVEILMKVYVFIPFLILMLFLVTITFLLLYYRKYRTAKNFAVLVISICISFFVLNTGNALSEVLFVPLSVMPLIIFRDKRISVFYLFFIIALSFVLRILQPYVDPLLHLTEEEFFFFRAMNIINGIVITYFITYYFKKSNESYESQLIQMNELIREKNKEITDSINYAKHIQNAILPSETLFKNYFKKSFILFKPKDIVAGDFYWMYVNPESDLYYFAAADCTGHGVPGAMVSVICSNALNRAVREFNISEPGKILDKCRELVISTFINEEIISIENSETKVKDGMDISLCCWNNKTNELLWSGANNPLWILRENSILEYKPDKQPIGNSDAFIPFTTKRIQLQKNDNIYVFTDGYADQFGGEKGKKFKYSQLKELLLKVNNFDPDEQKKEIDSALEKWKGELEQVDDILIIGIKI